MTFEFDPSIRRLPVYMLIDCSSSMNGDAIEAVDQGFKNLTAKLSNDPNTCDVVWFSVIAFDSIPRQMIPLCPISDYRGLPLRTGGSSNLGRALVFLNQCMEKDVRKQTMEQRGDWKPLVFLMSDGEPTDDWEELIQPLVQEMNMVACGMGADVNVPNLKQLTDTVVLMKDLTQETFNQFIDFLSSTMTTASQRSDSRSDSVHIDQHKKYTKIVLS
ncbi:MAG: hypothetical protein B6245_11010 [Desulfobacteraceae bacterium 4572_88]|nr:MAG: hypothetical protein B6245_11010 [Desulfobacteraceae bacterium 4572_88]